MYPALKSFMTSPTRPQATATIAATKNASVCPILDTALVAISTMMPKISMGLIPDWPTHCEDMAVASHTPIIVQMEATIPISAKKP